LDLVVGLNRNKQPGYCLKMRLVYVLPAPTVESVQSARIVVYSFVAGDIGADDTISGLNIRVHNSAIQYFKRRPGYGTSFYIAMAFVLKSTTTQCIIIFH